MCVGGHSDFFFEPGLNFCSEFFTNVRTRVGMCHFDPDSETSVSQIGGSEQGSDMTYGSPRLMEFNDVRASTFFPTFPQRNAIVNFPPDSPFRYFLVSGIGNAP
jgi:hypothetical protein